jgi:hypothetical protein
MSGYWDPWIPKIQIQLDTGSGSQKINHGSGSPKKIYGSGYRIWIPKKKLMDLDPKRKPMDLDTGSGYQKIFHGSGYILDTGIHSSLVKTKKGYFCSELTKGKYLRN